ncbi:uncharacterized protein DC041_0007764, partial [Schistosoma bovis]
MKVGIIGSGIIGLSTAFLIKENYSNVEILIQSDKKNVMVTSYGAAGIFRPDPKLLPGSEYDHDQFNDFIRWCNAGREQYWKLATKPRYYMNYLLNELKNLIPNDQSIYSEREIAFTSSNELYYWAKEQKINIIINCTGLGSGYLFHDPEIRPVKGQLVRVLAPWMKFGFYFG